MDTCHIIPDTFFIFEVFVVIFEEQEANKELEVWVQTILRKHEGLLLCTMEYTPIQGMVSGLAVQDPFQRSQPK